MDVVIAGMSITPNVRRQFFSVACIMIQGLEFL